MPPFRSADFLAPACSPERVDVFHDRRSILVALQQAMPSFHGTLLDIGCGHMPYRPLLMSPRSRVERYIGLDLHDGRGSYPAPDLVWDGRCIPLEDQSVDSVVATEVLEHCPNPVEVISEMHRVLRAEGILFFTAPFLWPLHDVPHDEYRYTPFALQRLLDEAGFAHVNLTAAGGWDASLAQMIGLWVRRRPMKRWMRGLLSMFATPVVRGLLRIDRPPLDFRRNGMITGISGTARKEAA
jgi:SAM-dependent methyltransferase